MAAAGFLSRYLSGYLPFFCRYIIVNKMSEMWLRGRASAHGAKRSIPQGGPIELFLVPAIVDPLSYFSFQPVLHDWCNKGRFTCYHFCEMVHIKEPLLLNGKSSSCSDGSRIPLSLSGPLLYVRCYITDAI